MSIGMKRKLNYLECSVQECTRSFSPRSKRSRKMFFRILAQARFPPLTRVQSTCVPEKKVTASFLEQRLFCPRAKLQSEQINRRSREWWGEQRNAFPHHSLHRRSFALGEMWKRVCVMECLLGRLNPTLKPLFIIQLCFLLFAVKNTETSFVSTILESRGINCELWHNFWHNLTKLGERDEKPSYPGPQWSQDLKREKFYSFGFKF